MGGEEEEEPSKFEKWLEKKCGDKVMNAVVAVGGVLGVALAVLLFFFLPAVLFNGLPGSQHPAEDSGVKNRGNIGRNELFPIFCSA